MIDSLKPCMLFPQRSVWVSLASRDHMSVYKRVPISVCVAIVGACHDPKSTNLDASTSESFDASTSEGFDASTSKSFDAATLDASLSDQGRDIPDTLYGVTTEYVSNLPALRSALAQHTKRPTTRIVFQQGTNAQYYQEAVSELRDVSYVMGQVLDSTALGSVSVDQYRDRTRSFVNRFAGDIDIYEIGNELNGEWVGTPTIINAKVQAAYEVIEEENAALNLRSAITLNFWPSHDCYSQSWEDTETYARGMPAKVKNGVDYIFLSFYETACSPRAYPTNQQFIDIFAQLKTIFPNAKIGIGELGAQGEVDGVPNPTLTEKERIANRYYGMHDALKAALGERYVGGGFWWYYFQDAVPADKAESLWPNLEQNFNSY